MFSRFSYTFSYRNNNATAYKHFAHTYIHRYTYTYVFEFSNIHIYSTMMIPNVIIIGEVVKLANMYISTQTLNIHTYIIFNIYKLNRFLQRNCVTQQNFITLTIDMAEMISICFFLHFSVYYSDSLKQKS